VSQVVALATLEGRKLLRHPVFLAGTGLAVLGFAMFVLTSSGGRVGSGEDHGWTVWIGLALLGLFTMVGTNRAALRDHREHTVEQHEALPVPAGTRTGGLLLATAWPAAAAGLLVSASVGYAVAVAKLEALDLVQLAMLVAVVLMFGTMGVAFARWFPWGYLAPLVAWSFVFWTPGEHPSTWHVLSPLAHPETLGLAFAHLAYVLGLTAVWCGIALLRDGARRLAVSLGVGGLAITVLSIGYLIPRICPIPRACLL
jgi:hypothetical protein